MQLGIIGLPQSGKTTLFNALTQGDVPTGISGGKVEVHPQLAVPRYMAEEFERACWVRLGEGVVLCAALPRHQPGAGQIILMHVGSLHEPEALPTVIQHILALGHSIVPLSEFLP